jgi:predicted alpha/beta superfamily hydrolase
LTDFHTHHLQSAALGVTRRVTVFVPGQRDTERCPVLYLNDGQNLFDPARAFAGNTWRVAETVTGLIEAGFIPPLIVVGIDHGEIRRAREYLPVGDSRNPFARRPLGRRYAEFVVREVMPFVQREFPVARGASNTGVGGSSYGAIAALFTALQAPGKFGRLLIESPSLYVGRGQMLRRARRAEAWPARVYLGVGTSETSRADWNEETVINVMRLEQILKNAGLGPRRLKMIIEQGATHSEGAWAARLPFALSFLFATRAS